MKELLLLLMVIGALFALIIASGGVLVWLAPVAEERITPAQDTVLTIGSVGISACSTRALLRLLLCLQHIWN